MKPDPQFLKPRYDYVFWGGLALLLLAAVILRGYLLNSFPLSFDEGIHLIWLRLLSAGYEPYSEVYITYPPLYPLAIEAVWKIWPTEAAQRWFSVACTLFGAVGIALLARKFSGNLAGLIAAAFTLFSLSLFESSRAILGEFPSIAWSVWAVWFAWFYRDKAQGRRVVLILSGLCLACSLLTKFLSPFIAVLIPLMIITGPCRETIDRKLIDTPSHFWGLRILRSILSKCLLNDLSLWGLALLLPIVMLIVVYDVSAFVGQTIYQRFDAYEAYNTTASFMISFEDAITFIQQDIFLVILALFGIGVAWTHRKKDSWIILAWLVLACLMLFFHKPVRHKHFFIFIPPFAILASTALVWWVSGIRSWLAVVRNRSIDQGTNSINRSFKIVLIGGFILMISVYFWQLSTTLDEWRVKAALPQPPPEEVEMLAFIDEVTAPIDCIITDDMQLLYWSGRMTPPELAEVSNSRIKSSALTLEGLAEITDRYDCQLVAPVSNRIAKYFPEYMLWLEYRRYLGRKKFGEDYLFFAKINTDPAPATAFWANFDDKIVFHGYTLPQDAVTPGQRLPLTLFWQAQKNLKDNYAIFVQLRDSDNNVMASADHQPYKALVPTSAWPRGEVIQETTWLQLPKDIPTGRYNIFIGLYSPDQMKRLSLKNDTSGENALILAVDVASAL